MCAHVYMYVCGHKRVHVCPAGNAGQHYSAPVAKTFLGLGNWKFSAWMSLVKLLWITRIYPTGFWANAQLNGKSDFSNMSF